MLSTLCIKPPSSENDKKNIAFLEQIRIGSGLEVTAALAPFLKVDDRFRKGEVVFKVGQDHYSTITNFRNHLPSEIVQVLASVGASTISVAYTTHQADKVYGKVELKTAAESVEGSASYQKIKSDAGLDVIHYTPDGGERPDPKADINAWIVHLNLHKFVKARLESLIRYAKEGIIPPKEATIDEYCCVVTQKSTSGSVELSVLDKLSTSFNFEQKNAFAMEFYFKVEYIAAAEYIEKLGGRAKFKFLFTEPYSNIYSRLSQLSAAFANKEERIKKINEERQTANDKETKRVAKEELEYGKEENRRQSFVAKVQKAFGGETELIKPSAAKLESLHDIPARRVELYMFGDRKTGKTSIISAWEAAQHGEAPVTENCRDLPPNDTIGGTDGETPREHIHAATGPIEFQIVDNPGDIKRSDNYHESNPFHGGILVIPTGDLFKKSPDGKLDLGLAQGQLQKKLSQFNKFTAILVTKPDTVFHSEAVEGQALQDCIAQTWQNKTQLRQVKELCDKYREQVLLPMGIDVRCMLVETPIKGKQYDETMLKQMNERNVYVLEMILQRMIDSVDDNVFDGFYDAESAE